MNEFITVFSAEMMRRLKSRVFWIGLMAGAVGLIVMIKFPSLMQSYANQAKNIVLSGDANLVRDAKPLLQKDFTVVGTMPPPAAVTLADLQSHNAAAVVSLVRMPQGLRATVYAKDPGDVAPGDLRRDLLALNLQLATKMPASKIVSLTKMPVDIRSIGSKFGTAAQSDIARITGIVLLSFLYALLMINSQLVMSSVAEEKTSRIAELLIASVSPSSLLAGKIAASATLAIIQMAVWIAAGFAVGLHAGAPVNLSDPNQTPDFSLNGVSTISVVGFVVFFLLGFLQMATLFAAAASLINRTEDLGSFSGPLFMPVIAAFFIAIMVMSVPDTPIALATSFIPLISPFIMFARIAVSDVPFWQIGVAVAINLASIGVIAALGGKIYRVGMLLYGRPPRLSQIWHVLRA